MYTNDNLMWSGRIGIVNTQNQAEEYVTLYPPGTNLWVYYNPSHPKQSALEPGVENEPEGFLFIAPFVAGGSFVIWWGISYQIKKKVNGCQSTLAKNYNSNNPHPAASFFDRLLLPLRLRNPVRGLKGLIYHVE